MLDSDNTPDNTPDRSAENPSDSAVDAKPARKAAAKRAPRKAAKSATKSATPAVAESAPAETPAEPSVATIAEASEAAPAPKKATRPRKAAAKKAAPAPAETAPTEAAVTEPALVPAAAELTATPAKAPAKRAPRKRAAKAVTLPAADLADETSATATPEQAQEQGIPAFSAPTVLFQPPSEAPAPSTTRRRRAAAAKAEPVIEQDAVEVDEELDVLDAELLEVIEPTEFESPSENDLDAEDGAGGRRRRRRGRRGRGPRSGDGDVASGEGATGDSSTGDADDGLDGGSETEDDDEDAGDRAEDVAEAALSVSARRRRRRRRSGGGDAGEPATGEDPPNTVVHIRDSKPSGSGGGSGGGRGGEADSDGVRGVKGSTRLEAKRQRRRDNRDSGRRRAPILTEAEFLARREAVDRVMAVRQTGDRTQIAVLEDGILVEHYVTRASAQSAVGNVYLARVQNVLPSMEAAFVDIGRGRNGVLYAGEVNWDAAGLEGKARAIENAMSSGDSVLVQVTKDPIGHKGARLTSQVSLPGRFVVYVPGGGMTGISRKLPDVERTRLKAILKKAVPEDAGVIVRTAAEGASEQDLISDVERLKAQWESIQAKAAQPGNAPSLVYGEPDLAIRVVRDVFNDDFRQLIVAGSDIRDTITSYVADVAPDLAERISLHTAESDLFHDLRVDEQLAKALDRKVYLPSGGSLVIDRTEAMVVIDVNTGKYTGSGGNLEQTVTRNNLEAAEEIVRQLRLRDVGGIVVIDFIDMVLESNRDLVLRRLTECLGRDRTKHQVAEVTSLGLVQMTRKRVGEGLLEAFSEPCEHCKGRGVIVHNEPVDKRSAGSIGSAGSSQPAEDERPARNKRNRRGGSKAGEPVEETPVVDPEKRRAAASAIAAIAAATGGHSNGEAGNNTGSDIGRDTDSDTGSDIAAAPADAAEVLEVSPLASDPAQFAAPAVAAELNTDRERSNGRGQSGADDQPATQPSGGRPRRRRGASRPAGPPVAASQPVS